MFFGNGALWRNSDPQAKSSGMDLTTKPIVISEQKNNIRPEFIRLPRPGTADPWTGLGRSTLNLLVLPSRENDYRPPVRSCTLRRRGNLKGVRLIDLHSLIDYINAHVESRYVDQAQIQTRPGQSQENASVHTVNLDESLRIILSVRLERTAAQDVAEMILPGQNLVRL